jgi:hypothetical protein
MSRKLKTGPKVVITLAVAAAGYFGVTALVRHTIYAPDLHLNSTPAALDLAFDTVTFQTADAVTLYGWFVPAAAEASDAPRPTVLLLRGRTGNISADVQKLRTFHDAGLDVLAFDYRGYGKSNGTPSEDGLTYDGLAGYFYLTRKRGVPPERLFFYGEGLGAAVAIDLAMQVPAAGLITEGAFTSMADIATTKPSFIPWRLLLRDQFNAIAKIHHIRMPLLMFHSSQDDEVPYRHAQLLYYHARDPKELITVTGSHDNAFVRSRDEFRAKIAEFVTRADRAPATEQTQSQAGHTS